MRRATLACSLLSAVILIGCATSPTGRSQFMLISPEAAIVESKQAYLSTVGQLNANNKLLNDPLMADRVATITGRVVTEAIAQHPRTGDWEWSVALIDDDETVNAWCMAGGRMAVYSGLIKQLELTDDELAQIMGHEIAHALANHTAERMSRAIATNLGIAVVGATSENGQLAAAGAALAAKMALELPNSRTAESEADRIGMDLAVRAGYAPEAAVSLWQKMGALGGPRPAEFLSTHPSPENRQATLSAMAREMRDVNPTRRRSEVHPVDIIRDGSQLPR
jgi:predicted Zn-dependent protease